jgi:hypothetical protein
MRSANCSLSNSMCVSMTALWLANSRRGGNQVRQLPGCAARESFPEPTSSHPHGGKTRLLSYSRLGLHWRMLQQAHKSTGNKQVEWISALHGICCGRRRYHRLCRPRGVFASDMTGNFALLACHVARGNTLCAGRLAGHGSGGFPGATNPTAAEGDLLPQGAAPRSRVAQ